MSKAELIRKAIESVTAQKFKVYKYASEGWYGYQNVEPREFPADVLLAYIANRINRPEFFDSSKDYRKIELENYEEIFEEDVKEAWPDGGPRARVIDEFPKALGELVDLLIDRFFPEESDGDYDLDDLQEQIEKMISEVKDGEYTFEFCIEDGSGTYTFAEDVHESIYLTAKEALALVFKFVGIDGESDLGVFDLPDIDEKTIEDRAKEKNFALEYDDTNYGWCSEELECYLDSWKTLIEKIESGEINEANLDEWLEYFKDRENFCNDIISWSERK